MAKHAEYVFNTGDIRKLINGAPDTSKIFIRVNVDNQDPAKKTFMTEVTASIVLGSDATGNEMFHTSADLQTASVPGCPNPPGCS